MASYIGLVCQRVVHTFLALPSRPRDSWLSRALGRGFCLPGLPRAYHLWNRRLPYSAAASKDEQGVSYPLRVGASASAARSLPARSRGLACGRHGSLRGGFGWHYWSNATCLIRPHLFYACFVVSRITIICHILRNF